MAQADDATLSTLRHSRRVDELILQLVQALLARVTKHDLSKMEPPEAATFAEIEPRLAGATYGSPAYAESLAAMGPALEHHYANNRHHPQHHDDGVAGMTLVDLAEMLADWRAAGERHDDGDMTRSLAIGKDRFHMSDQLHAVLVNTAREAGWL